MKSFTKGMLLGIGVGLLIAPMKGREMRQMLAERFTEWRNSLPADSPINQYASRVSRRVASTRENWRVYARQAVSRAMDTGATLGNKARQTGQDLASRAKQTVGRPGSDGSETRGGLSTDD